MLLNGPACLAAISQTSHPDGNYGVVPDRSGTIERTVSGFFGQAGDLGGPFVSNDGQRNDSSVLYYSRNVQFTTHGIVFRHFAPSADLGTSDGGTYSVYEMRMIGSNDVVPVGSERTGTVHNYFLGSDPDRWATGVKVFETVSYPGIYDGIDLLFMSSGSDLKYEFHVQPGADARQIRFQYIGAETGLNEGGIEIALPTGTVCDGGLETYKLIDGGSKQVASSFTLDDGIIGFDVPFDPYHEIVIDPLIYSTYVGGTGAPGDFAHSVAPSTYGYSYVTGASSDSDFPTTPGTYKEDPSLFDAFIILLPRDGEEVAWASFVGGSGNEQGLSIAVDKLGYPAITGYTTSSNFPTTFSAVSSTHSGPAGTKDAFVTKLDSTGGALYYSTYYGGSADDTGRAIAVDYHGEMYITGETNSSDLLTTSGAFNRTYRGGTEAFIARIFQMDLVYAAYLPGSGYDVGNGIIVDKYYNAYVTGQTNSSDFLVTGDAYDKDLNGLMDAFIVEVNESGSFLEHSTYLGGTGNDTGSKVCLNGTGGVFIIGTTSSIDFPVTTGAFDTSYNGNGDAFAVKMPTDLTALLGSTFIGGQQQDNGIGLVLDDLGRAVLYGGTRSDDLPVTIGAFDQTYNGGTTYGDAFLMKMELNWSALNYSTYLGGTNNDIPTGLSLTEESDVLVTGYTASNDYPTTAGVISSTYVGGQYDCFVTRFNFSVPPGMPLNIAGRTGDKYVFLTWEDPVYDGGAYVSDYGVYRGTDINNLARISVLGINRTNDTTVLNGKTYFYAITAINGAGEGARSALVSFTPGGPPTPPTNVKAVSGDKLVKLSWSQPIESKGFTVTNYSIYRGINDYNLSRVATLGKLYMFTDTNLTNGKRYFYAVTATNARGEGKFSTILEVTPSTVSSAPINLTLTSADKTAYLKWEKPLDDGGEPIINYTIYREQGINEKKISTKSSSTEYIDHDLVNGLTYRYSVSARNSKGLGNRSLPGLIAVGTMPRAPTVSSLPGPGSVRLYFEVTDNGGFPVLLYHIMRGGDAKDLSYLGNCTGAYYEDSNITYNKTFYYTVAAENLKGIGQWSKPVNNTPTWRVPGIVSNFTADTGFRRVILSWGRPLNMGGSPIIRYNIYRGDGPDTLKIIAVTDNVTFTDATVKNGAEYYYSVDAVNVVGEGDLALALKVVPRGEPGPVTITGSSDGQTVRLDWGVPSDLGALPLQGYKVYRRTGTSAPVFIALVTVDQYTDRSVVAGNTYSYHVTAFNIFGESAPSNTVSVDHGSRPGAPEGLIVKSKGLAVQLRWAPPSDNGNFSIMSYRIYRATSDEPVRFYEWTENTTFTDPDVKRGETYYYRVTAVNTIGEGNSTAPVKVVFQRNVDYEQYAPSLVTVIAMAAASVAGYSVWKWKKGAVKR